MLESNHESGGLVHGRIYFVHTSVHALLFCIDVSKLRLKPPFGSMH